MIDDFVRTMKEMVMSYFKALFRLSSTDTNRTPENSKIRIACNLAEIRNGYQQNASLFTRVTWKRMTSMEVMLRIWADHHSCRDELMKTNISAPHQEMNPSLPAHIRLLYSSRDLP
jgi:hypothetical protein